MIPEEMTDNQWYEVQWRVPSNISSTGKPYWASFRDPPNGPVWRRKDHNEAIAAARSFKLSHGGRYRVVLVTEDIIETI